MGDMVWAYLIHLGQKMWIKTDRHNDNVRGNIPTRENGSQDTPLCDKAVWTRLTDKIAEMGLNTLVIDLGEAVKYESHPEIAASNAWTVQEMKDEIKRLKNKGLRCIPTIKLLN